MSRHFGVEKRVVAALTMAALSACASSPTPIIGASTVTPEAEYGQAGYTYAAPTSYSLRPSDQISVNVFREPDFSLQAVRVGVDGVISMPMIGAVPVKGMTTTEIENDLTVRLAQLGLKSPRVSVNILEYASHQVTVEGSVRTPGVYNFQPGAKLSSAIAMAQGLDRVAKAREVAVFRNAPDGVKIALFDYGQVRQGTMLDPVLEPGDRVVVGTDGLSQTWQDALRAIPAFGIFANLNY